MTRLGAVVLGVLALVGVGCESEIVREDGDPVGGTHGGGNGGQDEADMDPAAECEALRLLMDQLPGCNEAWNTETCTVDLEFALEYGCLPETHASLRCYAETCEDAEVCRPEGDAFVACREALAEGSGGQR